MFFGFALHHNLLTRNNTLSARKCDAVLSKAKSLDWGLIDLPVIDNWVGGSSGGIGEVGRSIGQVD